MNTDPHFVVLRQEHIGALSAGVSCKSLEEAVRTAHDKTQVDSEPRYVVQLMFQAQLDPKPRVLVTQLGDIEVPAVLP